MEKEKGINTLSIVAFILSIVIFPVGLVLSIIGLVKSKNYKKEYGSYPNNMAFSIVGLVISIINLLVALFVLLIVSFVFIILASNEKYVEGNYTCYYPNSYRPAITAEFKNRIFKWSKYGDELNNSINGTYRLNSVETNNGDYEYKLVIRPKKINTNARVSYKNKYDIVIKKVSNKITITFDNGSTYNCIKKGINNEF